MSFWLKELERASKEERNWRRRASQVVDRYVDERRSITDRRSTRSSSDITQTTKFNILWSTTETIRPALISAVPSPEVRQRYKKDDPIARSGAKILERAIEFSLDTYDFIKYGKSLVQDVLLPGRGVTRVRYIPTFEKQQKKIPLVMKEEAGETVFTRPNGERVDKFDTDDTGAFINEEVEELVYEEVRAERVPWRWFRLDPADEWKNVRWVAFGAPFTKDEGMNEFGDAFKKVNVKKAKTEDRGTDDEALKDKIIVWEIWDKRTRQQIFIAEEHEFTLEENDDPLSLENFFPCPEPVYAVEENDTLVPTPEFVLWQDQADELDSLSHRIKKITDAIRAGGAYAGELKNELKKILTAGDNELIAIEDWMTFAQQGGLEGVISWIPVDVFAKVLQILETQRSVKVQEIFELTGIADIQRGATDPRETARAQQLKADFGNRRLLTKQQSIQNHFRDVFRLKAEIIAEQFDPQTLKLMVGLESENEVFDDAVRLIRNDALRIFNIDVETDTTIAPDEEREKRGLAEAMSAISSYLVAVFPLVQTGALPMPVAMGILTDYLRKFRFGRNLDDLLQDLAKAQQPPDPAKQQQQAEQQAEQQKAQQEMQQKQQESQLKIQEMVKKMEITIQSMAAKLGMDQEEHAQEIRQDEETHNQEIRQSEESHEQDLVIEKEMGAAQRANMGTSPDA